MKTILLVFCILGISTTVIFTTIVSHVYELVATTNHLINHNEQSDIEFSEDHKTHNDLMQINGKIWCEKTQRFYRIK